MGDKEKIEFAIRILKSISKTLDRLESSNLAHTKANIKAGCINLISILEHD